MTLDDMFQNVRRVDVRQNDSDLPMSPYPHPPPFSPPSSFPPPHSPSKGPTHLSSCPLHPTSFRSSSCIPTYRLPETRTLFAACTPPNPRTASNLTSSAPHSTSRGMRDTMGHTARPRSKFCLSGRRPLDLLGGECAPVIFLLNPCSPKHSDSQRVACALQAGLNRGYQPARAGRRPRRLRVRPSCVWRAA